MNGANLQQSRWKIYLGISGVIIVIMSLVGANYLASKIAIEEAKRVEQWLYAYQVVTDFDEEDDDFCDYTLHINLMQDNTTIPIIMTDENFNAIEGRNYSERKNEDIAFLQNRVDEMVRSGFNPIKSIGSYVFYEESNVLQQLRLFPILQLFLIGAFVIFGYIGINAARIAEQNRVWVGLAKETAHQLGTPISAIIAWIEHLRGIRKEDKEVYEVLDELNNDVDRLELIANRFSKIGSKPKLESVNIIYELEKCKDYMQRRAPRKVAFDFPAQNGQLFQANINPPLFDWVVENLLRNSIDAMDGKGSIKANISQDKNYLYIDLSDTGKGIPASYFKKVFEPGFTTKRRGWGLGLSLAKRIVEKYHFGKIFVKKSIEGEGTTFTIQLPKKVVV